MITKWTDIKLNWIKIGINTYQELVNWNWIKSETPNPIPDPTISFHHHGNPERIRNGHCLEMSKILKKSFLHKPIIWFHKTLKYCQGPRVWILCSFLCFFYSQKLAAADLHFMNHEGPQLQLKIFPVLLKKKGTYILDGRSLLSISYHWILQQKAMK